MCVKPRNCRTNQQKKVKKMGEPKAREVQIKLMRGLLDLVVMQFLKAQPMHGYKVIANLRKQFGVYFGPSTIYPLLSEMEENGYIKSQWDLENDRPRKVYSITTEGEELLSCTENSLSHIYRKLEIGTGKIPFKGNNLSVKGLMNDNRDLRHNLDQTKVHRF
jgi:PadR family transcriptional regulator PadR